MIHIATTDTFFIDAPVVEAKCFICGVRCKHEIGWIEERCSNCGSVYSPFEITMPDVVRKRRELFNLTRRQFGELIGYKPASVKRYEWVECTQRYFDATAELMEQISFKIKENET